MTARHGRSHGRRRKRAETMALFYVTGLPGTGKPAVLNELHARGSYAHGADKDG